MRLIKVRGVWTAHIVALAFGFAMFGTFVLVPTLLQLRTATGYGFGSSVSQAGLFLLPTVLMMVVFGPLAATSNAIIDSVPAEQTGEGIGVNTIACTVGSSIGTAVIAALISSNTTPQGMPTDGAFTIGFWTCAVVAVLVILAALAAPSRLRRHQVVSVATDDLIDANK